MSLVPVMFDGPMNCFDQNFGHSLLNGGVYRYEPSLLHHHHPLRHLSRQSNVMAREKDAFRVNLDVQQFEPEEISVKTVETSNAIVVDARHADKQDEHGYISRHFRRHYILPDDVPVAHVQSKLSSDGVLTIFVTKKALETAADNGLEVSVRHSAAPAVTFFKSHVKRLPKTFAPVI